MCSRYEPDIVAEHTKHIYEHWPSDEYNANNIVNVLLLMSMRKVDISFHVIIPQHKPVWKVIWIDVKIDILIFNFRLINVNFG